MDRPNVLLISVDQWTGRLFGHAGHPAVQTPTLDQVAANGVRFTNAYSQTPTCIPARRALMTGTTAKTHGDRIFNETLGMHPDLTTMPAAFRAAGYQANAVGKLHVHPQRDRIGFDDALICEEGRHQFGMLKDDYEMFLSDQGYNGAEMSHGMSNNEYTVRPWHLPENCHPTSWTTREMCRTIIRRDPGRPSFWFASFTAPHPPITPPAAYLDMYRGIEIDEPYIGEWAGNFEELPYALKEHSFRKSGPAQAEAIQIARAGFYAQCTFVDHQIRLLIGTLRDEGLLDDTILAFTCDHGDMLGNHGLWAKPPMLEGSVNVPLFIVPTSRYEHFGHHLVDDRLVELRDVMPTLLDMCGIDIPASVEGQSLLRQGSIHDVIYCEHDEGASAQRMIRDERFKLIYYPAGNRFQLFDLKEDREEMHDLADSSEHIPIKQKLASSLVNHLYGSDMQWVKDGTLIGMTAPEFSSRPNRGLTNQRGWRW